LIHIFDFNSNVGSVAISFLNQGWEIVRFDDFCSFYYGKLENIKKIKNEKDPFLT